TPESNPVFAWRSQPAAPVAPIKVSAGRPARQKPALPAAGDQRFVDWGTDAQLVTSAIQRQFGVNAAVLHPQPLDSYIEVGAGILPEVVLFLRDAPGLAFNMLANLTGVD